MAPQRKRIVHVADAAALAERACDELLELARRSIADQGTFRIALAGGSTPKLLYARLADQAQRTEFARWQVFFGDERNVAPDHADSNFRMASESWLARGQVPAQNIHRIEGELDSFQAAARYEQQLVAAFGSRSVPRFDVALLGMGADGHTASLFPNSSALEESRAFVTSTWVEKLGCNRITLTLRTLNAARAVYFLVAGADKAATLRAVLHDAGEAQALPVRMIQPWDGAVTWFVDRAAATQLGAD
ncbi:MAG: 6-phosphogluconolactonase [Planctomycetes bacterium]|nr:6-phosphogluconolactonase [Planctomycetota bacterium]